MSSTKYFLAKYYFYRSSTMTRNWWRGKQQKKKRHKNMLSSCLQFFEKLKLLKYVTFTLTNILVEWESLFQFQHLPDIKTQLQHWSGTRCVSLNNSLALDVSIKKWSGTRHVHYNNGLALAVSVSYSRLSSKVSVTCRTNVWKGVPYIST